ncbi:hypothetical protein BC834DRAFT_863585 [Gloeopeniophorella convolvens]|nr:hypothetical protein BC834DRAFT_863585 [Gloeopeniophorella convolvens]
MGGQAFQSVLPDALFPRLDPQLYALLKTSLHARLAPLFEHLGVPHEAPAKPDHGDVDFVAAGPRSTDADADSYAAVLHALGARAGIRSAQADARGTHNFALLVADAFAPGTAPPLARAMAAAYVQVDVNVRRDAQDWANVMFYHAYGDLGMLMGRLAAGVGLHLGEHGLKITSKALAPTYSSSFELSTSFPDILSFFELSMERYDAGFATQDEIFEWLAVSRFYAPERMSNPNARTKARLRRKMYQAFFDWSDAKLAAVSEDSGGSRGTQTPEDAQALIESVRDEALVFFKKQAEHDALLRVNEQKLRLKKRWNGHKVGEWTGWNGWAVGRVMTHMRQTVGEEKIAEMEEEELREHVLRAKETIALQRAQEAKEEDAKTDIVPAE